jgi:hypothetical protein
VGPFRGSVEDEEDVDVGEVGQAEQTVFTEPRVYRDGAGQRSPMIGHGDVGAAVANGADWLHDELHGLPFLEDRPCERPVVVKRSAASGEP